MPGITRSHELDTRRRRLLFRAWHRGTREMDLIMGRFAEAHLGALEEADLGDFESLIEVPDPDLFAWVAGQEKAPPNYDTALFRRLCAFHANQGDRGSVRG